MPRYPHSSGRDGQELLAPQILTRRLVGEDAHTRALSDLMEGRFRRFLDPVISEHLLLVTLTELRLRASNIRLYSNAADEVTLEAPTLVTIGVAGDGLLGDNTLRKISPQTDLCITGGDVTHRFNEWFVDALKSVVTINSLAVPTSGTYTPTLFNTTNVAASTAYQCQYLRVGNTVTVSGKVDIDPTLASVSTVLGISLPIASNFLTAEDCGGTAAAIAAVSLCGGILADTANDRATLEYINTLDVANRSWGFSYTYRVM